MIDDASFASASLPRHLARGAVGFGALIGSVALLPTVGLPVLLLLPVGVVALRGCPTCWLLGLRATISAGRLRRECVDGHCELVPVEPPDAVRDSPSTVLAHAAKTSPHVMSGRRRR